MEGRPDRNVLREIQRAIELVTDNPLIGRSCDEVRAGYRRHAAGSHTLYYEVGDSEDLVDVVRILHKHTVVERYLDRLANART